MIRELKEELDRLKAGGGGGGGSGGGGGPPMISDEMKAQMEE